jgi:hypothetical protein
MVGAGLHRLGDDGQKLTFGRLSRPYRARSTPNISSAAAMHERVPKRLLGPTS